MGVKGGFREGDRGRVWGGGGGWVWSGDWRRIGLGDGRSFNAIEEVI
jgi:hypothetical protein